MAKPGELDQPQVAVKLARELAIGEAGTADLARRYGCSQQAIRDFGRRHQPRVLEIRKYLDDQFAGIVFADKVSRVAALSDLASDTLNLLRDPAQMAKVNVGRAELIRAATSTLRAIADELGQIPQKLQVQVGGQLAVTVNGVSTDDLR